MYRKNIQRTITTAKNKALLGLLLGITAITTGCSSLPETITGVGNNHYGYKSYDPCIRCGESWVMLPNEEMAALKQASQQPGFTEKDYEAARKRLEAER